ncbi:MAG: hypothetical protein QXJ31_05105 [Candidatus Bathyarchaeia archaeon]
MRMVKLNVDDEKVKIAIISDVHAGHINHDKKCFKNVLRKVQRLNCLWIGGGDYGDAIIPNDPRFDYNSLDPEMPTPQHQYDYIYNCFEPIKSRCIGLLDGNHDITHWKKHMHNYVLDLSRQLGVEYLTIDAYIRLHFTRYNANFDIYIHHGWTSARTKGVRINRIYDLADVFPWADAYVMGHVHDIGPADEYASLYVDENMEIRDKLQHFIFAGSFLRGYVKDTVSYVEEKTFKPSLLGSPLIIITPKKGKATVWFNVECKKLR